MSYVKRTRSLRSGVLRVLFVAAVVGVLAGTWFAASYWWISFYVDRVR